MTECAESEWKREEKKSLKRSNTLNHEIFLLFLSVQYGLYIDFATYIPLKIVGLTSFWQTTCILPWRSWTQQPFSCLVLEGTMNTVKTLERKYNVHSLSCLFSAHNTCGDFIYWRNHRQFSRDRFVKDFHF